MNFEELVLACVQSLLAMEPSRWEAALTRFENTLGPDCSVRALAVPGKTCLGVRPRDGRELPLSDWRVALGLEAPVEARLVSLDAFSAEGLAPLQGLGLAVRTRGVPSVYAFQKVRSSRYVLSPEQWVEFLQHQPHPEHVRGYVIEKISEFNSLNERASFAPEQLEAYLCTEPGADALERLGGTLLDGIQRMLRRMGSREQVPDALRALFSFHDPDVYARQDLDEERQQEFVPSAQALQLSEQATNHDFIALVDAQPCARVIWERVAECFNRVRYPPGAATYDAASARERILRDPEDFQRRAVDLMPIWQGVCQGYGTPPILPEPQRALVRLAYELERERDPGFLPPEEALIRRPAEGAGHETLRLRELEAVPPGLFASVPSPGAEREAFVGALREAQAFAEKHASPFFEAFKLARFVLETDAWRLSAEPLSDARVEVLCAAVRAAGFSENAATVLGRKLGVLNHFEQFHPSEDKQRGLLASALASVFGGMGAWNDQYFERPEEQQVFEQVSTRLHAALNDFSLANFNAD